MAKLMTVVNVDPDAKAGTYAVTRLSLRNDEGEEKSYNIFKKDPLNNTAVRLQAGDEVTVGFVKKGKYWNLSELEATGKKNNVQNLYNTSKGSTAGAGGAPGNGNDRAKDTRILKSVALKAAIELVTPTVSAKTDFLALAGKVTEIAAAFEPYLSDEKVNTIDNALDKALSEGGEDEPF